MQWYNVVERHSTSTVNIIIVGSEREQKKPFAAIMWKYFLFPPGLYAKLLIKLGIPNQKNVVRVTNLPPNTIVHSELQRVN